jgi:hypothetical protein
MATTKRPRKRPSRTTAQRWREEAVEINLHNPRMDAFERSLAALEARMNQLEHKQDAVLIEAHKRRADTQRIIDRLEEARLFLARLAEALR